MSATLWVGETKESEVTLYVPSWFIDDLLEKILKRFEGKSSDLIAKIREGYAESTYMNLADLDTAEFQLIQAIILEDQKKDFDDFINERVPRSMGFITRSFVKAATLIDRRSPEKLKNQVIDLIIKEHHIQIFRWQWEFLLELIILTQFESLTENEIRQLYSYWLSSEAEQDIQPIQNVLFRYALSLKGAFTRAHTIEDFFGNLIPRMVEFLRQNPQGSADAT